MAWLKRLVETLRPARLNRDLEDEMQFHLEMRTEEYGNQGASADEARARALRRFGSPLRVAEETRDVHLLAWLDSVRQDVAFGIRMIRRAPVLSGAAVLSLALGIGATTGVFAVLDAAALRSLPVPEPRDLFALEWASPKWPKIRARGYVTDDASNGNRSGSFSYATFQVIERQARGLARVAGFQTLPRATTVARGAAGTAEGSVASAGFFEVVGVRPAAGRLFVRSDDAPGAAPVVVISHRFWQRAFGGDPAAIGEVLAINGHPFTVVGVTDARFFGLRAATWLDFYVPVATGIGVDPMMGTGDRSPLANPRYWWIQVVARRHGGVGIERLRGELDSAFARSLDPAVLDGLPERPRLLATPGARGYGFLDTEESAPVFIVMGLAALVLVVACANVGNLLAARASSRRHEAAMRMALGAGRWRLVRQQFVESLLLAAGGGAAGVLCGQWMAGGLLSLIGGGDALPLDVRFEWRTLALVAAVTVAAGTIVGLAAALRFARAPLHVASRTDRIAKAGWRRRLAVGRPLMAVQIASSLLVLVVAGLFLRSLSNLYAIPLGFNADRIVLFEVDPVRAGFGGERRLELIVGIRDALARLPEVRSVSWSEFALVGDSMTADGVWAGGRPPTRGSYCRLLAVGPGFHETLQIPLLLGRTFSERDGLSSPRVAVVNETFVKTYLADGPPVGQRFALDESRDEPIEVVGVVRNASYSQLRTDAPLPVAYLADAQARSADESAFSVRASGSTAAAIQAIRVSLRKTYPNLPMIGLRTFDQQLGRHLASERMLSSLSGAFAVLALVLAAVGLYGVVAFTVARRTPEIGVRLAIGATPATVMRMVLVDGARVVMPGVAVGLVAALAASRVLRAQLFALSPTDPATVAAALVLILVVSAAATAIPARRAARVDPKVALRAE